MEHAIFQHAQKLLLQAAHQVFNGSFAFIGALIAYKVCGVTIRLKESK